jgi:hypothetical protein
MERENPRTQAYHRERGAEKEGRFRVNEIDPDHGKLVHPHIISVAFTYEKPVAVGHNFNFGIVMNTVAEMYWPSILNLQRQDRVRRRPYETCSRLSAGPATYAYYVHLHSSIRNGSYTRVSNLTTSCYAKVRLLSPISESRYTIITMTESHPRTMSRRYCAPEVAAVDFDATNLCH